MSDMSIWRHTHHYAPQPLMLCDALVCCACCSRGVSLALLGTVPRVDTDEYIGLSTHIITDALTHDVVPRTSPTRVRASHGWWLMSVAHSLTHGDTRSSLVRCLSPSTSFPTLSSYAMCFIIGRKPSLSWRSRTNRHRASCRVRCNLYRCRMTVTW
jgi:hypothetical protein